ncbi:MAG: imelysin family protein [Alphaproteobacteria bacterium]
MSPTTPSPCISTALSALAAPAFAATHAAGAHSPYGDSLEAATAFDAASELGRPDLEETVARWVDAGAARAELIADGSEAADAPILKGPASLSYGKLAVERMKLGLTREDPQEEHVGCIDDTRNSRLDSVVGAENVGCGRDESLDRSVEGPVLSDLVPPAEPALDAQMRKRLEARHAACLELMEAADSGRLADDPMRAAGNAAGNALLAAGTALVARPETLVRTAAALALGQLALMGSDSLDQPEAVFP